MKSNSVLVKQQLRPPMHNFNFDPKVNFVSTQIFVYFCRTNIIANNNIYISII
jgi:hypothetical protein